MTSNEMPTTVDYTNILVNYIEVVAPHSNMTETQPAASTAPMPILGATQTQGHPAGTADGAVRTMDIRTIAQTPEAVANASVSTSSTVVPEGLSKPVSMPQSAGPRQPARASSPQQGKPLPKQILPRPKYTNQIPQFLLDLDMYSDPDSDRFQRSSRVISTLPQQTSLPMFLGKSILNGATPHKDDASVLIMPNHTVLNHLATSSIRNGVLATSGTTRYKRKVSTV
jgi:hypothetical protein